jgi:hypothetical protein
MTSRTTKRPPKNTHLRPINIFGTVWITAKVKNGARCRLVCGGPQSHQFVFILVDFQYCISYVIHIILCSQKHILDKPHRFPTKPVVIRTVVLPAVFIESVF